MAPKKLLDDPLVVEDSDDDTVDEEPEEEDGAVEAEDGKAKSGDDNHDGDEEEGDDEDADDEDEDENEEKKEKALLASSSAVSNSNPQSPSASEDDSGSGSETESENNSQSPSASDFTIKPIVSKPMNDPVKPNKKNAPAKPAPSNSMSKRPETEPNKKNAPPSSKRRAETEPNLKDSKKTKVVNNGDDDDGKKGRLWSEDDEIAILKGMTEYQAKNGPVTNSTMGSFHEFIKKRLQVDVSKLQLSDKIRRLKIKYQKKGENGEDPMFSKSHEVKSFDLSKKVWGVEGNGVDDNAKDSKRKPKKTNKVDKATVLALPVSDVAEKKEELNVANGGIKADPVDFWSKYPCLSGSLGLDNSSPRSDLTTLMIQAMPLIGKSKAKELEEKWRALQLIEMELSVKKLALMQEQAKLVLDSMKDD